MNMVVTKAFYSVEEFIKKHIRNGQHWNTKLVDMKRAKWQTLAEHTHIGGIDYAAGSSFKVFETTNFGWIVFRGADTLTPDGNIPGKFIHKW